MSSKNRRGEVSITFMSGPLDGKTMMFNQPEPGEQRILNIGRRETCEIHLPFDNQVSRVHARLGVVYRPGGDRLALKPEDQHLTFWLEDNGSRNGTFVEKDPDPLTERVSLRPGNLFRIGRTWMRLDVPLSFS